MGLPKKSQIKSPLWDSFIEFSEKSFIHNPETLFEGKDKLRYDKICIKQKYSNISHEPVNNLYNFYRKKVDLGKFPNSEPNSFKKYFPFTNVLKHSSL